MTCRTFVIPDEGDGNSIAVGTSAGTPIGFLLMLTYATGFNTVTGTPSGRSFVIPAEDRTLVIPAESRTLIIECEE